MKFSWKNQGNSLISKEFKIKFVIQRTSIRIAYKIFPRVRRFLNISSTVQLSKLLLSSMCRMLKRVQMQQSQSVA